MPLDAINKASAREKQPFMRNYRRATKPWRPLPRSVYEISDMMSRKVVEVLGKTMLRAI